jgi:glycosyltransferase involved in cell wall biosynthesis
MSVFIDVTDSCKSAKNTGVQRVTRQLFAALSLQTSVTPICWNRLGNYYHRLAARELARLTKPFTEHKSPMARPELRGEKIVDETKRWIKSKRIDLSDLKDGDVLLVPDIYTDRRTKKLPATIKSSPARAIAIFHDAATLRLNLFSQRAAERFRKYVASLAVYDLVICISEQSQSDLRQLWKEFEITPMPETCVERWPVEFDEKERVSSPPPSPRDVVLCVGSFDSRKNHLALLEAANQLWQSGLDFELKIIGKSTAPGQRNVIPKIRALQAMGRRLSWLKHVDDRALHRAYRECKFTVYPSLYEGFGLPILESLWHGKPCVCGNNGALGELANEGGCLVVDQSNPASLAKGIRRLLTEPETYTALSDQAQQRNFGSWSDYVDRLLLHFDGKLAPSGQHRPVDKAITVATGSH